MAAERAECRLFVLPKKKSPGQKQKGESKMRCFLDDMEGAQSLTQGDVMFIPTTTFPRHPLEISSSFGLVREAGGRSHGTYTLTITCNGAKADAQSGIADAHKECGPEI